MGIISNMVLRLVTIYGLLFFCWCTFLPQPVTSPPRSLPFAHTNRPSNPAPDFGLRHAGRRKHLIKLPLGKIPSRIEISDAVKDHPQVGIRMVDVVRSRGREAEEQPKLNDDQHQREH